MSVMTPQILKYVNSAKIQKSKYRENKPLFVLQIEIHSWYNKGYNMEVMEVMFNYFTTQLKFTCSKSITETLEKSVKYVQS